MDSNSGTNLEDFTLEKAASALLNMRHLTVKSSARELILSELGMEWAAVAKLAINSKMQLKLIGNNLFTEKDFADYFLNRGIGEIIKITNTRLQLIPTSEFIDKLLTKTHYISEDTVHKGSYVIPVGCSNTALLATYRDGVLTLDTRRTDGQWQVDVSDAVFIRRAMLEPLRRILRSRNIFEPNLEAGSFIAMTLHKSSLTLGNLEYLAEEWAAAIKERVGDIYKTIYGDDLLSDYIVYVEETLVDRWFRTYNIKFSDGNGEPMETVATAKLIDKTFFLEI